MRDLEATPIERRLAVDGLSRFPEAGKTRLFNHVLSNREGMRMAVTVSDLSGANVDARLVRDGAVLSRSDCIEARIAVFGDRTGHEAQRCVQARGQLLVGGAA